MENPKYIFPVKEIINQPETSATTPKKTYVIGTSDRGTTAFGEIGRDKKEMYQLVYDDNTSWFSDSDTLQELYPVAAKSNRDGKEVTELPLVLENPNGDRGFVTKAVLRLIHVFTKPAEDQLVNDVAKKLEDKHLDKKEGLNSLNAQFELTRYNKSKKVSNKPYLLFIHGTNSDTIGAFEGLKKNDTYAAIHKLYGDNLLAFQHRTLTQSPLKNAVDLAEALPNNCTLHLVSHSRGGLVGEILCKYASQNDNPKKGFLKEQIELLKKEERTEDLKQIAALDAIFKTKKIHIEKFVRVASPSAGTILASERMDHIFNVFFNFLDKTGPIAELTHDLIGTLLQKKNDTKVLPGLEAMNPASPFIKVLNYKSEESQIDGKPLMVISGNGKTSVNFHGLLVILGKLFYTKRNDLVVNTDSMYLGVRRKDNIQYFFDEGTNVDHVHYFDNKKTQDAVLNALKTNPGENIPGYKSIPQYEIPASDRGILGLDGGELFPATNPPSGKKPIVVLLPGIMGSNIYNEEEEKRMWLHYWNIVRGGLEQMAIFSDTNDKAKSVIKSSYNKLNNQLSYKYDVVLHPFDWRKPMEVSAREFNDKIQSLLPYNQPIKIIGHSMGGVLVRDFIVFHPATWSKLNASKDFKLLFLGSPLKGSHRILSVLFGKDGIINKLSFLDMKHSKKELIEIFTQLPGILSLLPFTTGTEDNYADVKTWKTMSKAQGNWPIPSQKLLTDFGNYRDAVAKAVSNGFDYSNMFYIAGQDKETPCAHLIKDGVLKFGYTAEGDQSVTWESGIPKGILDKNQVYYSDVTHGELANDPKLFNAIEDILSKGKTDKLGQNKPVTSKVVEYRSKDTIDFDYSENGLANAIFGISSEKEMLVNQNPITVSISHGDLSYASFPILAGHFNNDAILYAEKAIDYNVDYVLTQKNEIGGYPGPIGTFDIIKKHGFFEGAIIVGLGEPGKLTAFLLSQSVEIGVTNYLLNLSNSYNSIQSIGISSLLIASNFGGLTIETSMKAIINGVNNANRNIVSYNKKAYCTIGHIEFIELYDSNTIAGIYSLKKIINRENEVFNIRVEDYSIKKLFGSKKKLPIDNYEEWWNRINVETRISASNDNKTKSLVFGLYTGDARQEENELFTASSIADRFIHDISVGNHWTRETAQTLFEILIPNDFKESLKRKGNIIWIIDKESAYYPWEILQDNSRNAKPLCVDSGMVRQLKTRNYKTNKVSPLQEKALIIADPELNGFINQLSGAVREGNSIREIMDRNGYKNELLLNASASDITRELFPNKYKILHLAGHGIYDPANRENSGMVIGDNQFLTSANIRQMANNMPEMVFINCCHLGRIEGEAEQLYQNRFQLAANIGTEFIDNGAKVVITTGWQVGDEEAEIFAKTFYENMIAGETFGNAIKKARNAIYRENGNNTWGAYQCYGDPFYKLENKTPKVELEYTLESEVEIDLNNLLNKLDVRGNKKQSIEEQLNQIITTKNKAGIDSPKITETEAYIYYELGEYAKAFNKLKQLKDKNNGTFTFDVMEKYCNTIGYNCFEVFKVKKALTIKESKELDEAIKLLKTLIDIKPTSERLSLLASCYKRLAYVTVNDPEAKKENYIKTYENYLDAYENEKKMYPLNNYIVFRCIAGFMGNPVTAAEKRKWITELKERKLSIQNLFLNMDYWDSSDNCGIDLSLMFLDEAEAKKEENWEQLAASYLETRAKYGSFGKKKAELYNIELIIDALGCLEDAKGKITPWHAAHLKEKIGALLQLLEH